MTRPFVLLKRAFRNLYFLMFLNGFMLASLFYFRMESSYEDGLFSYVKTSVDNKLDSNDTRDSVVVKAMAATHDLMQNRAAIFANSWTLGPEANFFHSASVDLMTTRGACGSYSLVLARLLTEYQFPVRIGQMKANGIYGDHNVVEVNTGKSWVVLDPTFNLAFVRPDSRLASFADVKNNWNYYVKQTPKEYDPAYRYEDVRYTNWTKVPVLFPAIRSLLYLCMGKEKTEGFSIRTLFMRIYSTYLYLGILLYIPILLITFKSMIRKKFFPGPEIPFTFGNLVKYVRVPTGGSSYTH